MAPQLWVLDDVGNRYFAADYFTHTDTKLLCEHMLDTTMFRVIEQSLQIDLSPLMVTDWQDIDALLTTTEQLIPLFKRRTTLYQQLEAKRQQLGVHSLSYETFEEDYFFEGLFGKDMNSLAQLFRTIKASGASRIQFEVT